MRTRCVLGSVNSAAIHTPCGLATHPPIAPSQRVVSPLGALRLNEAVSEASFDAEVAFGYVVVVRRRDLDDLAVLRVEGEGAADTAVRADRVGLGLLLLAPLAGGAQLVLARRH